MTKSNTYKKAVRDRMAVTGENYTVASYKLEKELLASLTVWELGEDGDSWFVEGTQQIDIARKAVNAWLIECYGKDSEEWQDWGEGYQKELQETIPVVRNDWYWEPLILERADEDAVLKHCGEKPPYDPSVKLMTGCHFSL